MKRNLCFFLSALFCLVFTGNSYGQTISTFAGTTSGYSGDNGPASSAKFAAPYAIKFDNSGNLFVSDQLNHVVRKINTAGIITTVAGNTGIGYSGNNGPATNAQFNTIAGIASDGFGNLYIADPNNVVVRKVDAAGIVTNFAGNHTTGYSGDGFAATDAQIYGPSAIAVDAVGNVYFTEVVNSIVRKVNTAGIISTFAGNGTFGYTGDGLAASVAQLGDVVGLAFDAAGNLYIADRNYNIIRKVNTAGIISTYAGNGTSGYSGDGTSATTAQLNQPNGLSTDASGNLYIADNANNVIRRVNASGIISTIAGNHALGGGYTGNGGPATAAKLHAPTDVAADGNGKVYIADYLNNVIRLVSNTPPVFVFGSTSGFQVCQDVVSYDFTSQMGVIDTDAGQTETWSVVAGPSNGSLSGFPATASSGPGTISPTPLIYAPGVGYSGPDAFTIKVDDGAGGSATMTVTVNVLPKPSVDPVANQEKCNGAMTDFVTFTGSVTPTTYSWTSSNTTLGIAPGGSNTFAAVTVNNATFSPIIDTITIVPNASGCPGPSAMFTVTVDPTPDVSATSDQTKCNGDNSDVVNFTGDVSGTSYYWTNSANVGLATTGTGDILAQPLSNGTFVTIIDTVIVTPTARTCAGTPDTFTITVYPTPNVDFVQNQQKCSGDVTAYVTFSGSVAGTTFDWLGSDNTVGIPASGIDSFTSVPVTNLTNAPIIDTITIHPTANGCPGTSGMFTVTVSPIPTLSSTLTPAAICDSVQFVYYDTSNTLGIASISWIRDTLSGISEGSSFGTDSVKEYLENTSNHPISVTYAYTLLANSCVNTQSVVVVVNPKPVLSSTLLPASICDSTMFVYPDTSNTTGITSITWVRDTIAGIMESPSSGADSVNELLVNTTHSQIPVVYTYTLWANGCVNTQYVVDTVNPRPTLSTTLTPHSICNNDTFKYVPVFETAGTTFAWSRAFKIGISDAAANGMDSIKEKLTNITANPISVTYVDTLTFDGCMNTQNIVVAVNPTPKLSSNHKPAGICSGDIFNYTPTSATLGAAYVWHRPYVPGIAAAAGNGVDNPNEPLGNTTYDNINVLYVYTVSIDGCNSAPDSVIVLVHPTPTLYSPLKETVCSGAPFKYVPQSYTPAPHVTYSWARGSMTGITPLTGAGTGTITATPSTGVINETLVNSTTAAITAQYLIILKVDGVCQNLETVAVTVNPAPATPVIAIKPPASLCANTHYMNFGAAALPPAGTKYMWSAINGDVWATGNTSQNALISFKHSGNASVVLSTSINSTACKTNDTFALNIGTSVADDPQLIFYNGQFMCLQNGMDSYQWGYDNTGTLDSTLIPGEVNQVYFNSTPDFIHNYYWLMTMHNGCLQKTYYNLPTGITNVNAGTDLGLKVYPNPTSGSITVEINDATGGNMEVEIMNLLGQKLDRVATADNKATFNVSGLAGGCYLVNCYRDGVKIGAAKFAKN